MRTDISGNHRRSIRVKDYDYSQAGAYFITICTHDRACLFGKIVDGKMTLNDAGRMAESCWQDIPDHFSHADLDEFVIMPNHIHGIIMLTDKDGTNGYCRDEKCYCRGEKFFAPTTAHVKPKGTSKTVGSIVRGFKIGVTKWMRHNTTIRDVWQRNYWEHIIRNDDEMDRIRQYILDNPAQWDMDRNNPNAVQQIAFRRL